MNILISKKNLKNKNGAISEIVYQVNHQNNVIKFSLMN